MGLWVVAKNIYEIPTCINNSFDNNNNRQPLVRSSRNMLHIIEINSIEFNLIIDLA